MSKSFVKKDVLDLEHLEFDLLQIFVFTCSIFVLILFMKAREQFVWRQNNLSIASNS